MTELSPEARAILDAGRDALSPSATTKAKVLEAVNAKAGSSALSASSGGITSTKLLMLLLVAAGITGGLWLFLGDTGGVADKETIAVVAETPPRAAELEPEGLQPGLDEAEESAPAEDTGPSAEDLAAAKAQAEREAAEAARLAEREAAAAAEIVEKRRADLAQNPKPKAKAKPKAPAAHTLLAERRLIGAAQKAIRGRKYEEARSILAEHKREFPDGILSPERDAAQAMALCLDSDPEKGADAAKRFLRRHKNSPLAQRVKSVCQQP